MLELVQPYLPIGAIAAGALALIWGQRDRLVSLAGKFRPAAPIDSGLTPHDLFERLYDLRTWCVAAGQSEAVKALDTSVLPAIVRRDTITTGGSKP
jgi:hypothetical protein